MTSLTSELTADHIIATVAQHAATLRTMGARKLGLFGSFRRGTATTGSDIDFLLTLARPSFDDYMDIKFFLEDLFNRKIDLVLASGLKPRVREPILNEVWYVPGFEVVS